MSRRQAPLALALLLGALAACPAEQPPAQGDSASPLDAGSADTALADSGPADQAAADRAQVADAFAPDTAQVDSAVVDTLLVDAAQADTAVVDAVQVDSAVADSAVEDAAQVDSAVLDAAQEDAAPDDATAADQGSGDATVSCAPGFDDCDGQPGNGCETDLSSAANCGACGNHCSGTCSAAGCDPCDQDLAVDTAVAGDAAKAMGLCGGLSAASWVLPSGISPPATAAFALGHGVLAGFGPAVAPREGAALLALSTGTARQPTDPGYQSPSGYDKGYTADAPPGFPKAVAACPSTVYGQGHDAIGLQLELAVPEGVSGFSFDFKFYAYDWPSYVCSNYNDYFVALVSPPPAGQSDGNVAKDSTGNAISVNSPELFTVCDCVGGAPCEAGGLSFACSEGDAALAGTGFGSDLEAADHAATRWLRTSVPATGGSNVTLRLAITDSGDGMIDSTVLVDNFRWLTGPVTLQTVAAP